MKPLKSIAQQESMLKSTGATKKTIVIYLQEHECSPKQEEDKPSKEKLENILRIKPAKSAGQLQLYVVREW